MRQMDVKKWLQNKILEETDIPLKEISLDATFEDFNMDSLAILSITFDLEEYLSREEEQIDPSVFTEFNTINKLALWIEQSRN